MARKAKQKKKNRHHVKSKSSWGGKVDTETCFNVNPLGSHEDMVLNLFKRYEDLFTVIISKAERHSEDHEKSALSSTSNITCLKLHENVFLCLYLRHCNTCNVKMPDNH